MKKAEVVLQSQIEHKTGLSIGQLRKWRQRYGFPPVEKGSTGGAIYSIETVEMLLLIKRLLEEGYRPGEIISKSLDELKKLIVDIKYNQPIFERSESIKLLIEALKISDLETFLTLLRLDRSKNTILEFCRNTISPLMVSVGESWANNEIDVYHEHLCTSYVERFLISETQKYKPKLAYPIFLFALPPKEYHQLGLLMVEAVIAEHGGYIINIGASVPLSGIRLAAISTKADVVAVSFSFAFPARDVLPILNHLRRLLPAHIEIWVGGSGVAFIRRSPKGIRIFRDLNEIIAGSISLKAVH